MFRRLEDFRKAWVWEAEATLKVLNAIPDSAQGTVVAEGHRDLRRMAWHLVDTLVEMPARIGVQVQGHPFVKAFGKDAFPEYEPPTSMEVVRTAYAACSESLLKGLEAWTDATLELEDEMYCERWQRGFTLACLLGHQTHHRGQMTVLLRQAGLKSPDIYGPAKEGWAAVGMEAPKI
jgi:uncharacterized damage-inducible protein DinB